MIPFIPLSAQIQFFLVLSASFALAALQNVTVDDAVLTGPVVPQYLPSETVWNQGSNCTRCFVKPDPSRAYNGTWHDSTYSPSNGYTQVVEFAFTGSALYIFFILANTAGVATTFTNVEFVLDGATVGTFLHVPSTSTDYEYNVPVYVNDSLVLGQHQMTIQPINSGNDVLILFDYLIYTVDTPSSVSSSGTGVVTITSSPPTGTVTFTSSPPMLPSSSASSKSGARPSSAAPNIGAIVGGTLGGVAALVIVVVSLLCHHRRKRGDDGRSLGEEGAVVDPFILSSEVGPTPLLGTTSPTSPVARVASGGKAGVSPATAAMLQTTNAPGSSSGGAVSSSGNSDLIEQVELLRDEVARLRHLQDSNRNTVVMHTEAPPEYSEAGAEAEAEAEA